MSSENESLYEIIRRSLVNGELPEEFSLSSDMPKTQLRFADGALDGIAIYHMGHADISKESIELLEELMHDVSDGKYDLGEQKLEEFASKNTAINAIDDFEGFIFDNTSWINPNNLHRFAEKCIMSTEKEIVKYGLEMIEVFSEPDENLKEIIRTLGLCDEFTIFAVFNMRQWSNSNDEIFAIAQKVHGWGRIHALERLEPADDQIKKWILREGIANNIVQDYSALVVFDKADIRTLLQSELTEDELNSIAVVISSLLNESPVPGISAVGDADKMLLDFLNQVMCHDCSLTLCEVVLQIVSDERFKEVKSVGEEILHSKETKEAITNWVTEGKAIELAQYLDIAFLEPLYQCMAEDFEKHFFKCSYLVKSDDYREKVLELFRRNLPINEMATGPEDNLGLGKEYENHSRLGVLIQELKAYPLCGLDFIILALKSPVNGNRNMALTVLDSWCKMKNCTLGELSTELLQEVEVLKVEEISESVLKNIEKFGF